MWGHNVGLADHLQANEAVAGTIMNRPIGNPPAFNTPREPDKASALCVHGRNCSTLGVYRAGSWFVRYSNSTGTYGASTHESAFPYGGAPGDVPLAGDWDGDGKDTARVYGLDSAGVWRSATWYLRKAYFAGEADITVLYGLTSDKHRPGDWR
jgi:hypothetical protein